VAAWPPKSSGRSVPGTVADPRAWRATRAAPMCNGTVLPSLLNTTRSCVPPTLRRATWRMVCCWYCEGRPSGRMKSPPHRGWVAAIQLGLQCSAAAGRVAAAMASARAARRRCAVRFQGFFMSVHPRGG